jgi:hypothetical protein
MDDGVIRQAEYDEKILTSDVPDEVSALLWLRLSRCVHRNAQQTARRNDQTRCRPLQLADRQMGMGRAAERTEDVESGVRCDGSR